MAKIEPFKNMEHRLNGNGRVYLSEFLEFLTTVEGTQNKIDYIRRFSNKGNEYMHLMRSFMECMWHPGVVFKLPEGIPPYKKQEDDYNLSPGSLFGVIKKIHYFAECPAMIANHFKREAVFIQQLESMYYKESELLLQMKDKKLNTKVYPRLTKNLFEEAIPGVLPIEEIKE